jgi:hypothetical protein
MCSLNEFFIVIVLLPTAVCDPPCLNGGVCSRPGVCSCPSGFLQPRCSRKYLTDSMGIPASWAATQRIPNILWKPKVHYSVLKSLPLVSKLSYFNSVHSTPSYISKIHFNIFAHLRLGILSSLIPFVFSTNIRHAFFLSPFVLHVLFVVSLFQLVILRINIPDQEYNL